MMKKLFSLCLILLFLVSLTACDNSNNATNLEPHKYDKEFIKELDEILESFDDINNTYGATVSYNGTQLAEQYFNYDEKDFDHNVFSVTKSVTSILVGIAIDKGYINSVEDYISEYVDITLYDNNEELETIQIKHLLTMSAGLYWDSSDLATGMITLRSSSRPLEYVFERDMTFTPGSIFNYSDGSAHIMSIVLEEATGLSANDFAYKHLFEPLGIEEPYWNDDSMGYNIGGCDLFIPFSAMEKIGNLVLSNGVYNEVQIVSSGWLEVSTTHSDAPVSYYGYYWWLSTYRGYDVISAKGWGGQFIYIIPELKIVITTGANGAVSTSTAGPQFDQIEDIVVNDILKLFVDYEGK